MEIDVAEINAKLEKILSQNISIIEQNQTIIEQNDSLVSLYEDNNGHLVNLTIILLLLVVILGVLAGQGFMNLFKR